MPTFPQVFRSGQAHRMEFIFHVGGMPWAVATSQDVINALTSALRRTMFGSETYNSGGSYWADIVDIYPYLEVPGEQSISIEDVKAEIGGGTWTAKIADLPAAATLWKAAMGARSIWGLEGLAAMANPRVDSAIKAGRVAEVCGKADTTVTWTDDLANTLYTAANAASSASPKVVWIGGECLAFTTAVDNSDGSYTGTSAAGLRGLLNSKACYHAPNRYQDGAPSEIICEYPLNGIIGRPYYLWAFALDDTGALVSGVDPVKFRHGKIGTDIRFDGSFWDIQCLPWWKWLDTEINTPVVSATMDHYIFSRPNTAWGAGADDAMPHLMLEEYDHSGGTTTLVDVWLCPKGETIRYADITSLEIALADAMTTASAASGAGWVYTHTSHGAMSFDMDSSDWFRVIGHLPFMLNWYRSAAFNNERYDSWMEIQARNFWNPIGKGMLLTDAGTFDDDTTFLWLSISYADIADGFPTSNSSSNVRPKYILQWYFTEETLPDPTSGTGTGGLAGDNWSMGYWSTPSRQFPIPTEHDSSPAEYRIYISPEFNITSIGADCTIQCGSESISTEIADPEHIQWYHHYDQFYSASTLSRFLAEDVGAGGATTNYILCDVLPPDTGLACIVATPSYTELPPKKIFYPGQMLFYSTACHAQDPWPIIQSFDVTGDTLGELYKVLLGETVSGAYVAEEIQADFVPDYTTVDWDQLDDYVGSGDLPFEASFSLRYSGKINLWQILIEELKFYGISPTWEWDSTYSQYRIKFRRSGIINATMAYFSGHRVNSDVIQMGTAITAEQSNSWQLNSIDLSMNWDPVNEEFGKKFQILDHSGYAPTGGKVNTVKIEPKITHVPSLDTSSETQAAIIAWFSNRLDSMMFPRPSQNVQATLYQFLQMGVGVDCLVTATAVHNPYTGEPGITNYPAVTNQISIDPSKGSARYNYLLAGKVEYGWAPSLLTKTISDKGSGIYWVTDIYDSGQKYCGTGVTSGWYDHWFFADVYYNSSVSAPVSLSSDQFIVTATEYGTVTPTVITGIEVHSIDARDYTTVTGAGGNFLVLHDATATLDAAKTYYITFGSYNATGLCTAQKKWIYIASGSGALADASSTAGIVREWT